MKQELFKGKYRIPSARLQSWDYGSNGMYFITICTKDNYHFFGEVLRGEMILSRVGVLADVFWYEIKNHAQYVTLGDFVVMPNHVHGILILNQSDTDNLDGRDKACLVSTGNNGNTGDIENIANNHHKTIGQKRFQNQGKNTISSIVGSYKSAVTKHANRLGFDFAWQSRFYDHIIRDHSSYLKISEYIRNNPLKWQKDCFYDDVDHL